MVARCDGSDRKHVSISFRLWSRYVATSKWPILIGPWRSELGFETLYWLPWLAHWRARYRIPRDRLFVVARGGSGVWYDAVQSVDLYDYAPLAKLRQAMLRDQATTASVKQQRVTDWERRLLPVIAHDLGLRRYHLLHPSVMYRRLTPWWNGEVGLADLLNQLAFAPLRVPSPPLGLALPDRYAVVSFYARHTWPLHDDLKDWVITLVETLSKRIPVVLLDSGLYADEHVAFPLSGSNILSLKDHLPANENLAVQSAVLAKAQCFVGTYGGTMQLAVRLKKPAIGFFSKFEGTCYAHKVLTEYVGMQQGVPTFICRPDDARFVWEVVGV